MEFSRTRVDGVPVYWTEAGDEYGAGLLFRVGHADETLARSGLTHLVEHLALHAVEADDYHANGQVDATTTTFVMRGAPDEVGAFLTAVCGALSALPTARMETEKDILRTEAANRGVGAAAELALWRYGAATYGLAAYPEFGTYAHTAADVRAWTEHRFTRDNAVLVVIGGPPPDGLRLNLPPGERHEPPTPSCALPVTPAFCTGSVPGAALSGLVPRGPAAQVLTVVLDRALRRSLRGERGLSYTVQASYSARDADTGQIVVFADAMEERRAEVVPPLVAELDRLAAAPVDATTLADAVRVVTSRLDGPDGAAGATWGAARAELFGRPVRTLAELRADTEAVTAADVHGAARAVLDSALLLLPGGQEPGDSRFVPAPERSLRAVEGRVLDGAEKGALLIAGADGLTAMAGSALVTVRYDACAAVLAWPDGARRLFGLDGLVVHVEPRRWHGAEKLAEEIDAAVPPDVLVLMPERAREDVPEPVDGRAPEPPRPEPTTDGKPGRFRRALPPAWDAPALAAALPAARAGDLRASIAVLAALRGDAEHRALATDQIARAVAGRSPELAALAEPDDPEANLLLGAVRVVEAWNARTAYQAQHVSDEQFATFFRFLALAGPPLYRAAELLPDDAAPWVVLQQHAIGLQLGRDELDSVFAETNTRSPFLYAGHWNRAQALCRKWWGSDDEVLAFGTDVAGRAEPGDPVTVLLAVAHLENDTLAAPDVHATLADVADRFGAGRPGHPRVREAHHLFGAAFFQAGDRERARRHLRLAGRTAPPPLAWGYHPAPEKQLKKALRALK